MLRENNPLVSIIILSYNRPEEVLRNVSEILQLSYPSLEIIVVDNNSDVPIKNIIGEKANLQVVRLAENQGVAGRNEGIRRATGRYLITLDDDVFGINDHAIHKVVETFEANASLGALNFKVIDDLTERQINWCHHRRMDKWSETSFMTYEISEGAVAFRGEALKQSGLYPEYYFISHEGPDLALRLMNAGYDVAYCPEIQVRHSHAPAGRPGWRRYYYDTRNMFWLAIRCYPFSIALRKLPVSVGAMLIYALRDGYLRFWLKGVWDATKGANTAWKDRTFINRETLVKYKSIERENPSVWYMFKTRLFQRGVNC